jgi:hypothetical protein
MGEGESDKENEESIIDEDDFVVFSLDDENIDNLGKVIGTKYSREFLKVTQSEELNLKEIAKRVENNPNPRLPNPTHHKNRLRDLGLVLPTLKLQRKKGHTLNFYKGKKIIIIVPDEMKDLAKNSEELKKAIKNIFKF